MLTRVVSVPGPKSSVMFDVRVIVLRGAMAVCQAHSPGPAPVNPVFSPKASPQCPLNMCPGSPARAGSSSSTFPSRKPCPPPTMSPGSSSSGVGSLIQSQQKVPRVWFDFYHRERSSRVEWLRCLQTWVLGF